MRERGSQVEKNDIRARKTRLWPRCGQSSIVQHVLLSSTLTRRIEWPNPSKTRVHYYSAQPPPEIFIVPRRLLIVFNIRALSYPVLVKTISIVFQRRRWARKRNATPNHVVVVIAVVGCHMIANLEITRLNKQSVT